jgi:hypothetical protein
MLALQQEGLNVTQIADVVGVHKSNVSRALKAANHSPEQIKGNHPQRIDMALWDGVCFVGSDAHIWPGPLTTAQRGLQYACGLYNPEVLCLNGDVFDGAKLSRFPPPGWEAQPDPEEELTACKEVLSGFQAKRKVWTLGNHDWRFERYIAQNAPALKGVLGVHLKDHFPDWEPCWRLRLNGNVNVKHRWKGGDAAPLANTIRAGQTIVTGHLHSLNVMRYTDYNGDRWGVDSGTLARIPGEAFVPQFTHYIEDNPVNWASGFIQLSFWEGRLLWPEIWHVIDEEAGLISFRGEVFNV